MEQPIIMLIIVAHILCKKWLLVTLIDLSKSYIASMSINYDSRVILTSKLIISTTLDLSIMIIEAL